MISLNRLAASLLISSLTVLSPATVSFAQEFDWNDDLLQLRNPVLSRSEDDNGLPGVRKNPLTARSSLKNCDRASLGKLLSGELGNSGDCPRRSLSIFELKTDDFGGSSR